MFWGRVRLYESECKIIPQVQIWWADIEMKVRCPEQGTVKELGLKVQ